MTNKNKRAGLAFAVALLLTSALAAQSSAPVLSEAEISAEIHKGATQKKVDSIAQCSAGAGFGAGVGASLAGGLQYTGDYKVQLMGRHGWIANKSFLAARVYKPIVAADIAAEHRTQAVIVRAMPDNPTMAGNVFRVPPPVQTIVLKAKATGQALTTEHVDITPIEWKNLAGGSLNLTDAWAFFDFNAYRDLPKGDLEIVLVTVAGERRCSFNDGVRQQLFAR